MAYINLTALRSIHIGLEIHALEIFGMLDTHKFVDLDDCDGKLIKIISKRIAETDTKILPFEETGYSNLEDMIQNLGFHSIYSRKHRPGFVLCVNQKTGYREIDLVNDLTIMTVPNSKEKDPEVFCYDDKVRLCGINANGTIGAITEQCDEWEIKRLGKQGRFKKVQEKRVRTFPESNSTLSEINFHVGTKTCRSTLDIPGYRHVVNTGSSATLSSFTIHYTENEGTLLISTRKKPIVYKVVETSTHRELYKNGQLFFSRPKVC